MVYQMDGPTTLLEVLAQAGGIANDAGDTVLITRPVQTAFHEETPGSSAEPPEIGPEALPRPTPDAVPSPTVDASPKMDASSQTSPHAPNAITINLNELVENGDATNNISMQAGDIITVPHAGIVYVLGAVSRPGGFVLANDRGPMTTLKILALAGGLSRTAKSDHAVILRKDNQGKQHEVAVDLKKVSKRESEDVALQPSDILFVPESGAKQAAIRVAQLAAVVGTSLLIYRVGY
jgi:polysaccharide export outer membrane protein